MSHKPGLAPTPTNTVPESTSSRKKLTPIPTKDHRRREHALFLTLQELELMKIVWELGEASVAQVKQRYQSEHSLAYTTIMTVLSRLEKKRMLKQRKAGKAFLYSAVYSREAVAEAAIDNLARIFFKGSRDLIVEFCRGDQSLITPRERPAMKPGVIDETLL